LIKEIDAQKSGSRYFAKTVQPFIKTYPLIMGNYHFKKTNRQQMP